MKNHRFFFLSSLLPIHFDCSSLLKLCLLISVHFFFLKEFVITKVVSWCIYTFFSEFRWKYLRPPPQSTPECTQGGGLLSCSSARKWNVWKLLSLLLCKISRLVQNILTDDQGKHANVIVNQMSKHICFHW